MDAAPQLAGADASADDFKLTFLRGMAMHQLHHFWRLLRAEKEPSDLLLVPDAALTEIKFAEALPGGLAARVYRNRFLDFGAIHSVIGGLSVTVPMENDHG